MAQKEVPFPRKNGNNRHDLAPYAVIAVVVVSVAVVMTIMIMA